MSFQKRSVDVYNKYHNCKSCGKSFFKAELKKHIHTIHDYKCEYCGKSFTEAHHLKKHIHKIHEGYKDHKCNSCGKSFSEVGA